MVLGKNLSEVWGKNLSEREKEVSGLVARGLTNEEIGKTLDICKQTVKTHLRNIYSKTDIHDRANLAIRVLNSKKI